MESVDFVTPAAPAPYIGACESRTQRIGLRISAVASVSIIHPFPGIATQIEEAKSTYTERVNPNLRRPTDAVGGGLEVRPGAIGVVLSPGERTTVIITGGMFPLSFGG